MSFSARWMEDCARPCSPFGIFEKKKPALGCQRSPCFSGTGPRYHVYHLFMHSFQGREAVCIFYGSIINSRK